MFSWFSSTRDTNVTIQEAIDQAILQENAAPEEIQSSTTVEKRGRPKLTHDQRFVNQAKQSRTWILPEVREKS